MKKKLSSQNRPIKRPGDVAKHLPTDKQKPPKFWHNSQHFVLWKWRRLDRSGKRKWFLPFSGSGAKLNVTVTVKTLSLKHFRNFGSSIMRYPKKFVGELWRLIGFGAIIHTLLVYNSNWLVSVGQFIQCVSVMRIVRLACWTVIPSIGFGSVHMTNTSA